MECPKVSIIISNYNYAEYLTRCVESVLGQTYKNTELIIVDDGSTDGSRELLKHYSHSALILLKPNGGESSSRNEGFSHSTGEIVAFLDSDDFWQPHAVATVVGSWKSSFSKLQFPLSVVDSKGVPSGARMPRCRLDSGSVADKLLSTGRYITCPTSGNFYPRWLLEKIIPVPTDEWPQSADSYLATFAGFYGEIGTLEETLGSYRVHSENMTRMARDSGGVLDITQLEKIMSRGLRLRNLVFKIALDLHLTASPTIVTNHWLYLKLELARLKLIRESSIRDIAKSAWLMALSALKAPELGVSKKAQIIAWIIGSLVLPKIAAEPLLRIGFDIVPDSWFVRSLRRL